MALQSMASKSALTLKYNAGVDINGKAIVKSKKYSNIKTDATDQDIYDTAAALAPLMKFSVTEISRSDENILTDN